MTPTQKMLLDLQNQVQDLKESMLAAQKMHAEQLADLSFMFFNVHEEKCKTIIQNLKNQDEKSAQQREVSQTEN